MNDRQWQRRGHDHGEALARDHGFVPVYVLYNSGLSIAENGRLLAERLEELSGLAEIALLGHSMGGLVARSACHQAELAGLAWRKRLSSLVTLGSPHLGAPLERYGSLLESLLPISSYSAPLARLGRSSQRRRHGSASRPRPSSARGRRMPRDRGRADRLVPIASAHGAFPRASCSVVPGANHLDLLEPRRVRSDPACAFCDERARVIHGSGSMPSFSAMRTRSGEELASILCMTLPR